jgi:hypothetical protein
MAATNCTYVHQQEEHNMTLDQFKLDDVDTKALEMLSEFNKHFDMASIAKKSITGPLKNVNSSKNSFFGAATKTSDDFANRALYLVFHAMAQLYYEYHDNNMDKDKELFIVSQASVFAVINMSIANLGIMNKVITAVVNEVCDTKGKTVDAKDEHALMGIAISMMSPTDNVKETTHRLKELSSASVDITTMDFAKMLNELL